MSGPKMKELENHKGSTSPIGRALPIWRARGALGIAILFGFVLAIPTVGDDHLAARRYSVLDGLSQNSVYAIVQDRRGFLWLGTEDGLNRFDGYEFTVYRPDPHRSGTPKVRSVMTLYEDGEGALWIGGRGGGLDRFDPDTERFTSFEGLLDRAGERRGTMILEILEDRRGDLWIATWGDGLYRIDAERRSVERWLHDPADPDSPGDDQINALLEDHQGLLWLGTEEGLDRFDPETGRFEPVSLDDEEGGPVQSEAAESGADGVSALFEDHHGRIWAGRTRGWVSLVERNGLSRWRTKCPPMNPALEPEQRIVTFLEEPSSARVRERGGSSAEDPGPEIPTELWVITSRGGLVVLDPASRKCAPRPVAAADPRPEDYFFSAHRDAAGDLWIGTLQQGILHLYHRKPFGTVRPDPGDPHALGHGGIWALWEDREGDLWIGTEGGGLYRRMADPSTGGGSRADLDASSYRFRHYRHEAGNEKSLPGDTVWSILEDHRGTLWVGIRRGGLARFDRRREVFHRYRATPGVPKTLQSDLIRVLYEDRAGTLWIGTSGGGLQRYDRNADEFDSFLPMAGPQTVLAVPRNNITAILENSAGMLWIGTHRGLVTFDGAGFRELPAGAPGLLSRTMVRALHEDGDGRLWIGTDGDGLYRFDRQKGSFTDYQGGDGLPSDVIWGILEDEDGFLWLSTNGGLSRFDPTTETFRNYDANDGLQSNEFNFGAHFRSARGVLYFGGVAGYNAFRPDEIRDDPFVPPVVITDFQLFNRSVGLEPQADGRRLLERPIGETRELRLAHRDRVISFEFAALSFAQPEKNAYSYRLEGFDENWTKAGARRFATYTNLPPGDYVFRVKGANHDGVWNEAGTSLAVHVAAPFWMTLWFRVTVALALVLSVIGYFKYRTHRIVLRARQLTAVNRELARRNEDLERFSRTISHDLRNPLLTIRAYLGSVESDALCGETGRIRGDAARIYRATDEMERRLHGLLQFSSVGHRARDAERVDLGEVAAQAVGRVQKATGVSLDVSISSELGQVRGNRLLLGELFEHLLHNAARYRRGDEPPRVEIGARPGKGDEGPIYYVADNGIGVEPRHRETIFGLFDQLEPRDDGTGLGLAIVKRIVEEMGGRVWVESEGAGRGSAFCFTLAADGPDNLEKRLG